jgi:Protein of unknown function (DUF3505).
MKNTHKEARMRVDKSELADACKRLNVALTLPKMQTGQILQEIQGLEVFDGLACTMCAYVCRSMSVMNKHHSQCHPEEVNLQVWKSVKVQQLNRSNKKAFFQILPSDAVEPTEDDVEIERVWKAIRDADKKGGESALNARQVTPWLLTTRWHEHVAGYETGELKALVAHPKRTEFPRLLEAIKHLFEGAICLIDETPELVLQRLNTPDPDKTYVFFTKTTL